MPEQPIIPRDSLTAGGVKGPDGRIIPAEIKVGDPLEVNSDGYKIFIVKYLDPETQKQGDGAIFDIEPNRASGVMRLTRDKYKTRRQVVKGSGWALLVSSDGEVKQVELNADRGQDTIVQLEGGWVDSFVAGPDGMQILDIGQPPFELDFEEPVKREDPSIPAEYWQAYDQLTQSND